MVAERTRGGKMSGGSRLQDTPGPAGPTSTPACRQRFTSLVRCRSAQVAEGPQPSVVLSLSPGVTLIARGRTHSESAEVSTLEQPVVPPVAQPPAAGRLLALVYATTILISAFLLFQVQPLISKAILPWFGGSPAVWTTCVLFFQTLLFAGYLYAHLSEHRLRPGARLGVHLGLIVLALLTLPIAPSVAWKPVGNEDPALRILVLLGASVGLPYLVLASTGPLVQAWFSRSFPGRSPYRLYALSNVGSLAALVTYPFLVEPNMTVGAQAWVWSLAFVAFAMLGTYGAIAVWRRSRAEAPLPSSRTGTDPSAAAPSVPRRLLWVLLPALASMALLATTNYVCRDLAVIPFLWVVPLSLYLLSFIICFDHERWYWRPFYTGATALLLLVVAGWDDVPTWVENLNQQLAHVLPAGWALPVPEWSYFHEMIACFAALFGLCMVCHGELVRVKPHPRYLTSFYLWIAAGGALGGLFVSVVAPWAFDTFMEWELTLIGGYLVALIAMLAPYINAWQKEPAWHAVPLAVGGAIGFWGLVHVRAETDGPNLLKSRSFYGELTVVEHNEDDPDLHDRTLLNGTIIHGAQRVAEEHRREKSTYYSPESGLGQILENRPDGLPLHVGVIGLGTGTVAVYGETGDRYRFYEINPEVPPIAREFFTYLSDTPAEVEIVLGDARLSMEREEPQNYDVLVLDAFSGDAIPVHLLTREAFETYLRHMVPDGVICVHISNRYLDLQPVVRGIAKEFDLAIEAVEAADESFMAYNSDWMVLSQSRDRLTVLQQTDPLDESRPPILWTDDYSNLFEILYTD